MNIRLSTITNTRITSQVQLYLNVFRQQAIQDGGVLKVCCRIDSLAWRHGYYVPTSGKKIYEVNVSCCVAFGIGQCFQSSTTVQSQQRKDTACSGNSR